MFVLAVAAKRSFTEVTAGGHSITRTLAENATKDNTIPRNPLFPDTLR